ncbi:MAG: hypothetical protein M1335_04220 [Chloroflexi bacterium]|nr:hypothetical protein [Chloroflexota bacterium]
MKRLLVLSVAIAILAGAGCSSSERTTEPGRRASEQQPTSTAQQKQSNDQSSPADVLPNAIKRAKSVGVAADARTDQENQELNSLQP